jgi:hypothetical protein
MLSNNEKKNSMYMFCTGALSSTQLVESVVMHPVDMETSSYSLYFQESLSVGSLVCSSS